MRIAIAVATAAVMLLVALVLVRSASPPPAKATALPPATAAAPATAPESSRAVPSAPPVPSAPVDRRALLVDLARALHRGDEAAARALLDRLRLALSPPIPDEENAAIPILQVLDSMAMIHPAAGRELQAYGAVLSGKNATPEDAALLRTWLDQNPDATGRLTELLRSAADRPRCRFEPDPDRGIGLDGRLVPRLQRAAQFLCIQAAVLGAEGKNEAAGDSLRSALSLSRAVHSDPTLLSQMAGCALDTAACEVLQRPGLIAAPGVADGLSGLDSASLHDSWTRAILGEAVGSASQLLRWRAEPATAPDAQTREWANSAAGAVEVASYLEGLAEVQAVSGRSYSEVDAGLQALARKYGTSSPEHSAMSRGTIPAMPGIFRSLSRSEAGFSAARLALDLHAYRARRGVYPETLDALGTTLPVDPFSGLRFIYRTEGGGFLLQSPSDPQRILWGPRP